MMAADLFGKPSKILMKKYKAQAKLDVDTGNGGRNGRKNGVNGKKRWSSHSKVIMTTILVTIITLKTMEWIGRKMVVDGDKDGDDADKSEDEEEPMNNGNDDNINHAKRKLSPHEAKSQKLQQQIERLEQDMMAEKPSIDVEEMIKKCIVDEDGTV
jgi:hypothetical protein